jgi:hypothetical protein
MDYLTLFLVASPALNAAILTLLLIHVILSEQHNRRSETLEQQILEHLEDRQSMPTFAQKGKPTRKTPIPVSSDNM